jgi:cobalt-precorrin-7 (C5)-methyltransferase
MGRACRMAVKEHKITIVGCGPGSPDYITAKGLRAIGEAEVIIGAKRLLETFGRPDQEQIPVGADITKALDSLAEFRKTKKTAVLVSGDPGLKSLASNVIGRFGGDVCEVIPGISSVQTAFARLGLSWYDARIISAHEGNPPVEPSSLVKEEKVAILAGGDESIGWVKTLSVALGDSHLIYLCRDLTLDTEEVRQVNARELGQMHLPSRSILLFIKEDSSS